MRPIVQLTDSELRQLLEDGRRVIAVENGAYRLSYVLERMNDAEAEIAKRAAKKD